MNKYIQLDRKVGKMTFCTLDDIGERQCKRICRVLLTEIEHPLNIIDKDYLVFRLNFLLSEAKKNSSEILSDATLYILLNFVNHCLYIYDKDFIICSKDIIK